MAPSPSYTFTPFSRTISGWQRNSTNRATGNGSVREPLLWEGETRHVHLRRRQRRDYCVRSRRHLSVQTVLQPRRRVRRSEKYYYGDKYRLEVPEGRLNNAQQILERYFFYLRIEDDLHSYCIVMEQGDDYSDVLRNSVLTRRRGSNIVFLMKDLPSIDQAVEQGARRLSETNINAGL